MEKLLRITGDTMAVAAVWLAVTIAISVIVGASVAFFLCWVVNRGI